MVHQDHVNSIIFPCLLRALVVGVINVRSCHTPAPWAPQGSQGWSEDSLIAIIVLLQISGGTEFLFKLKRLPTCCAAYVSNSCRCVARCPLLIPEHQLSSKRGNTVRLTVCSMKKKLMWVLSTAPGDVEGEQGEPECSQPPWGELLSHTNAGGQGQGEGYNWPLGLTRSLLIRGSHFGVKKTPPKASHWVKSGFDRMEPSRQCKQI